MRATKNIKLSLTQRWQTEFEAKLRAIQRAAEEPVVPAKQRRRDDNKTAGETA